MTTDPSNGWDAIAADFIAARSGIGSAAVLDWARSSMPPGATLLDIGCGSGFPIARTLADNGFSLYGIDASVHLIAEARCNVPEMVAACEAAETSRFFDRTFDGVLAIGLIFLLAPETQESLLSAIPSALKPNSRLLFTAPEQEYAWPDTLTGRISRSLGAKAYTRILSERGLEPVGTFCDEGGNTYFDFRKA